MPFEQLLYPWTAGALKIDIAFLLDPLSAVMLFVVTFVGFLIHVYSVGYMAHEEGYRRYFAYLNLFMGAMLLLILGDNYLVMFVGWEGVGLCSYLLIGFYFDQDFPPQAGRKAFIVNRIGDFAFLVGLFAIFSQFGTLNFKGVNTAILADVGALEAPFALGLSLASFIALFLFIGAMGKSAQIPLYVWLPDAMAGPTPVSALIHAATMVTAGVYMVVRTNLIYQLAPVDHRCSSRSSARPPRSSPPRSASRRTTSRRSSPTRPSRSSATCSWPPASAPTSRRSSTSPPTPSSRRCSSSVPAR